MHFVGASGKGKSTFLALLVAFRRPQMAEQAGHA